ncbi:hypothetical protein [Streptosporangium lutulentum]|uniref:Helix-turn-helix domain-containing protein n=1 Tax=Streptosporangium lutulentum TaxID=1461250 RepID=A0ABT9QBE2_9ACTN|nr:hypothetical protein [Streptosporangium lutulentum]MDP9844092.1 hypothetical protein [Streptosporangium lutulentum]
MSTPDDLEGRFTLLTAVARYDRLRTRDALASAFDDDDDPRFTPTDPGTAPLARDEALELLALGEVIARKAGYGRQLSVRSARRAGASWSQIGAALGTSKQAAWETHGRWIDDQAEQHRRSGYEGLDENDVATARAVAGEPESEEAE